MSSTSLEQELIADANLSMQTGYAAVAMLSLVVYDYLLHLDLEVEFIWSRKASSTNVAYILMRYLGIVFVVLTTVLDTNILLPTTACFPLFSTTQIACIIINLVLQGMMSMRVYVLFGRSNAVLFLLGSCFVVAQLLKIGFNSWFLSSGPTTFYEFSFLSVNFCVQDTPLNRVWTYPGDGMTMLVFETILCAFVLRYAFKSLEVPFWQAPTNAAVSLGSIMVRDNLAYFFIALINTLLIAVYDSPTVVVSIAYSCISLISTTILWALVGPWMIIGLRKSYERDVGEETSREHELTSVAFVTPATPRVSYTEV